MPCDAIVVGSGPNGLAAAITLAQAGLGVEVREAAPTIGGGLRTHELTLSGFRHDLCASVLPLAAASPFLRELALDEHGLELLYPEVPLAHPLDDGPAARIDRVPMRLDRLVRDWPRIESSVLGPPLHLPRAPLAAARFALTGALPCTSLARRLARPDARALLAGAAAHSILPLESLGTAGYALVLLTLAHRVGWPVARGGSQSLADALASYLRSLGGELHTGARVTSLAELDAPVVLLDVGPRQLVALAGGRLASGYARRYRYGPGVFKVDYALDASIPWRDAACATAGTVHLGGTLEEIAASEREPWRGRHAERPFVILVQPTVADPSRAPDGKHVAWAYCHVPNGSAVDMTGPIEAQIERFAPGFRDLVLARSSRGPRELEASNPNLVGGDINGGAGSLRQLLARPVLSSTPYRTPLDGVYLCSASTPPGGGVHGMCGHLAARAALRDCGLAR